VAKQPGRFEKEVKQLQSYGSQGTVKEAGRKILNTSEVLEHGKRVEKAGPGGLVTTGTVVQLCQYGGEKKDTQQLSLGKNVRHPEEKIPVG